MATKKVERLGTPRTAPSPSPLKGKASDTKDRLIDLTKGAASGSRAIKGDNSPESTAPFKGVCPTKPRVPNAKTIFASCSSMVAPKGAHTGHAPERRNHRCGQRAPTLRCRYLSSPPRILGRGNWPGDRPCSDFRLYRLSGRHGITVYKIGS
jgi:hypothetical protein